MEIHIQGHNLKLHPTLEDYTRKKLSKLDRYLPNIREVRVELEREHTRRGEDLAVAQITIRHARGAILRAEETVAGEIEAAINLAVDKMYRQIQRFKGKRERKGRERFVASIEELDAAEPIPEVAEPPDEYLDAIIVRRKQVSVSAMTELEAIEQMELLGHTFFVFHDSANGSSAGLKVVYKRHDGTYGVLQPTVE
jgi:putative sigma-54 modulation protein